MSLFKLSRNGVRMMKELFVGMLSSLILEYFYIDGFVSAHQFGRHVLVVL